MKIKVPSDINHFIFDYYNSKFIECNRPLAEYNANFYQQTNSTQNYTQNLAKNEIYIKYLNHTISKLDSLSKRYWLAGGTLLGKS
jgi:hypothetical protein